jgi:hypothetical protein
MRNWRDIWTHVKMLTAMSSHFELPSEEAIYNRSAGRSRQNDIRLEMPVLRVRERRGEGQSVKPTSIGYEAFPEDLRKKVVTRFPRVNFKEEIAKAFLGGFESKTQSTEGTCNEDVCSHFIRNYRRSNFYEQIQNSPFQNS